VKGVKYNMKTIKWGIIGAGNISSSFATALNSMEYTEVTAVASRDLERAQKFAERFQIKKAYGSYDEIVKDPELDVIYIGTPHSEHMSNAALCIMNGKSVLCEKAFTVNYKEAEYLVSLARKHKVFLMEAMWSKFLPVNQEVKRWVMEKKIGEISRIHASFGFYSEFNSNSRLYDPKTAGGALLDVGVYPLSYAIYMLGKLPDQVVSSAILGKSNVDEQNSILLHYKEGIIVNISSAITSDCGQDVVIIGNKGKIRIPSFWNARKAECFDASGKLVDTVSISFKNNGYEYEAEEVNRCLREGKMESDINSLTNTLDVMKIMDQVRADWGLVYPQEQN
jgi:predicted dehydrogenase